MNCFNMRKEEIKILLRFLDGRFSNSSDLKIIRIVKGVRLLVG